jgi:type IVB pilus formation R64 PilN family outer membrane protein
LDLLATKVGYVYTINKDQIYWKEFVTRTFDIAFMPGGTDYMMGGKGGSSSSSGSSGGTTSSFGSDAADAEYSNISGKLSLWTDLNTTIQQLLSPDGKVTVSQATTSVTVRDRATNVDLIEQYIRNLNTNLSKQVLVKIQILEVDLENDFEFGINWTDIIKAFHNSPFQLSGNYGTPIAITSFTPQPTGQTVPQIGVAPYPSANGVVPSYTILFNALSQQGKTSVVSEPRVVCLNNQVSVVRITESEGYVASIQNTSTGGGGTTTAAQNTVTSQVTPGTLITGLTLYVLPKIMGEKIYMQVNADLSTLTNLQPFGATGSQVQLPTIKAKQFNQRSVIRSGDTLILSGFRQVGNQAKANQFLKSQALGGKGAQEVNSETVVLITPIILHGSA